MSSSVELRSSKQGSWFESRSPRYQKKLEKLTLEATHDVIDHIGGRLQLPGKVILGFAGGRLGSTYAYSRGRSINFCESSIRLLRDSTPMFMGLVGHELSHLSDFKRKNNCNNTGFFNELVSEGKAEAVGVDVGGQEYEEYMCEPELLDECGSLTVTYPDIERLARSPDDLARRKAEQFGGDYFIGLSIVREVVETHDTDIYGVHARPVEFFKNTLEI